MSARTTNFPSDDILAALGLDPSDSEDAAALEDAAAHSRLVETLMHLRTAQHLSQRTVADRMGTTQSRVSSFERLNGDPRLSTLFRYARAVNARLAPMVRTCASPWGSAKPVLEVPVPESSEGNVVAPKGSWTKVPA